MIERPIVAQNTFLPYFQFSPIEIEITNLLNFGTVLQRIQVHQIMQVELFQSFSKTKFTRVLNSNFSSTKETRPRYRQPSAVRRPSNLTVALSKPADKNDELSNAATF